MTRKKSIPPSKNYPTGFCPKLGETKYRLIDVLELLLKSGLTLLVFRHQMNGLFEPTQIELNQPIRMDEKVIFQCQNGHRGQMRVDRLTLGKFCPLCSLKEKAEGQYKYKIEDLKLHAHRQGGACLNDTYRGIYSQYKWLCKLGHEWNAAPKDVMGPKQTWCPVCARRRVAVSLRK